MRMKMKIEAVGADYKDITLEAWKANINWNTNTKAFESS
jgi:hypothetical protein